MANNYIPGQPWSANPKYWDTIELAGKQLPGLASVEVKRGNKWDTKQAKGQHGAKREFNGADLAKVRIVLRFITADEHEAFVSDHLPGLEPTPGKKKPDVISVGHAVTAARSVPSITIDEIDGPKVADGITSYIVDGTEFREPEKKNAVGTARGLGPGLSCPQYLAAYQKAQAELAAAQSELVAASRQLADYRRQREAAGYATGGLAGAGAGAQTVGETQAEAKSVAAQRRIAIASQDIQAAVAAMTANRCPMPPSASPAATGGGNWYSAELKSAKGTAAGGTASG